MYQLIGHTTASINMNNASNSPRLAIFFHDFGVGGAERVMLQLARDFGTAFVLVTHDETLATRCGRRFGLVSGRLSERG